MTVHDDRCEVPEADDRLTAQLEQDNHDITALSAVIAGHSGEIPEVMFAAGKLAGIADRRRDAIMAVLALHPWQGCATYLAVAGVLLGDDLPVPGGDPAIAQAISDDGCEAGPAMHLFSKLVTARLCLQRIVCTCGWRSKARWNSDRAADDLIRHMADAGTEMTGESAVIPDHQRGEEPQ